MLKNIWSRFIQLKAWQRIAILVGIFFVAISSTVSETSTQEENVETSASPSPTTSPTAEATPSPSESLSPSPSESPTPETPLEFRFSALRDLKDLRKDVNDARVGISEVEDEEKLSGEEEIDHARDIYSWLTWLQSNLLEEMNS